MPRKVPKKPGQSSMLHLLLSLNALLTTSLNITSAATMLPQLEFLNFFSAVLVA